MRLSVLALIFCLFVFGMRGATVTWLASVTSGDWSNANNWIGGAIPAVGDIAVLVGGTTVSVSSQITIDTINFGAAKLIVTNNALLTVNNQFIPLVATNIQVDSGSTLNIAQFVFNGQQINFVNFGSITTNPLVTGAYGVGSLTNVATGNNVFFYGTKTNQINANFYVPSGFTFGTIQQTFATTLLGATLTLGYTENVNNWIFDNPTNALNLVLQNGANINGAITVTNTGVLFPRPTVTFAGAINVVNTLTMDCVPVVGNGGVVVISGQTLNFFNYGVTVAASRVQGTGSFNFNNQNVPPTTASFSQATSIENANFNFLNNWIFSGAVTYNVPKSFGFNVTLNSGSSITFKQATTLATSSFFISGGGQLTFTDSIISNNAITFTGFIPTFDCSLPNKAFAITGNSQLSFPAGLTVNGCAVSSSAQLTVSVSLTTVGGNTTLPTSPSSIVFNNGITFSSPNSPSNSLYCILLAGQITVPNAQAYTANRVEVVLPASPTFVVSDNAQLNSLNGGLFTLSGGVQFGSGINTGATLAFNSGTPSITSTARVDLSGALLLRNTIISGTADIWFNGQSITSTKGVSTISNPNFKFKQGLTLNYLWDQNFPNTGCQLVINNGPSGVRVIEKDVTANPGSNIVFDDNVNFNTSVTVSGSVNGNVIGAVTFRQTGQAQGSVTTNAVVTLNRNIYVNNTNFHFMGIGNYLFGNNANLFVQGNINNPTIAGDAVVTSNTPLTVGVVANSTFGNTFIVNSDLTTDDLDGIATTAVSKLTLNNAVGQSRNINGAYTLGASLTFAGNVVVQNGATINTPGTIEILGSSITLQASPTWRNKVVFPGAMTVSSTNGANTLTLGEQNILHGLNIPTTFTVNNPASVTFDSLYTVNFLTASTLSGTGAVTFSNTFATSSGLVTISPQTVTFTNVSLVGTGSFNVNPVDANLNIGTFVRAFVPTTYPGATLQVNGATTISNLVSFTANPLTINGNVLTISPGAYSVNTRWVNNNNGIVFQGIVTLATTGSFAGTGTLTFNNTLALTQSTTISQNVIFGLANNYIVTVSNAGFVLTLTGSSVTVNSLVVSNGGSIVSTSQPLSVQTISGGGSINSDWTWTNTVKFGQLNVTGARTLTFSLLLTSGSTTYFNDGVTFNGGTFDTSVSSDTPTLGIEKSITTNQNTLLVPNIAVRITGTTFTFGGSNVLTLNGTVDCFATVTFNTNVIFGYATPTTGNTITLRAGSTGWFPASASIQVWRTSFVTDNTVVATIAPSLIFGLDSIAFTTNGNGRLTLNGNLNVLGTSFSTSSNVFLGVISINSAQNNTLSNLNLLGTLTLNSSTIPWVEPVVSINTFTQTLVLNGPARMNTPIFGPKAQVVGPARLAITNSLEVQSTFQFGAPVQLYVNSPAGVFTFKLTNSQTNLLFTSTPSLFNPLGYNTVLATNFALNSDSQANILRFALNSQLTVGDLYVNAGILQFSGSSVSSYQTTVAGGATLWIDGSAFTGNQVIFNQNNDGTNPSVYQLTISSANPPAITTQAVVYKGIASLAVVNFNWDGTPITGITATSTNGATANFLTVTGNAGYQYSSTRSGNNVQFRRSANPSVSPFPTQSNGPSPAVSSSSTIVFSVYLMISIFLFVFFN